MKKQFQAIRFSLFVLTMISGIYTFAHNNVPRENAPILNTDLQSFAASSFNYSWNAEAGAVSYQVDMVHTTSQESYNWETTATSIFAFNLPGGTYELTLRANYSSSSSSIIIEEFVQH